MHNIQKFARNTDDAFTAKTGEITNGDLHP